MSDVVVREIMQRRLANVEKSERQIRGGFEELHRHIGSASNISAPPLLPEVVDFAFGVFDDQLKRYIALFEGHQIDVSGEGLASRLFERYFDQTPPFGGGRDKKHEFPDAMALLSLESYAEQEDIEMVVVSKDDGWKEFAARSDRVYHVNSLQELADLFESTSEESKDLRRRLSEMLRSGPALKQEIHRALVKKLPEMRWLIPSAHNYRYSVSGTVHDLKVLSSSIPDGNIRLWITSSDRRHCVAEIVVEADVSVDVELSVIDRDLASQVLNSFDQNYTQRVEAKALLHVTGNLAGLPPSTWHIEVDVGDEKFFVDVGTLEKVLPAAKHLGFDDMDDDIPF